MRAFFIAGFVVMVVAQWFVPLSMMRGAHQVIEQGTEYRFKTRPIDPSDPFRGKYVTLDYEEEMYTPIDTNELHFETNQEVYALLAPDSAGFMKIIQLSAQQPESGIDYIAVKFRYSVPAYNLSGGNGPFDQKGYVNLEFPFKRFYVEESKASEAEHLYWSTRRDSSSVCYAKIKAYNGKATLVDVMIDDRPILDIVREMNVSED